MGKKKGGKKKGKKSKNVEPERLPTEFDELGKEELEARLPQLKKRLEKLQLERNYMQLERDTISTFYDITKKEVKELEYEILQKDREMEMMEENHNVEVRVYIQKVKHLEYEHKNDTNRVNADGAKAQAGERSAHQERDTALIEAKGNFGSQIKENERKYAQEAKNLKALHTKNLDKLQEGFEDNLVHLQKKYEAKLDQLKQDLELRRKVEIHEIEERKNLHINDLMRNHDKAFGQIKNYYNDITHDNLKLIKALKNEVASLKKKAEKTQGDVASITQENKRLMDPLSVAVKEVSHLKTVLKDREKDTMSLKNARSRMQLLEVRLKQQLQEHANLEAVYARVETERDRLYDEFEETVRQVQRQGELKNMVLHKKLRTVDGEYQERDTQLREVLRAADLDPMVLQSVEVKLNEVLDSRNSLIRDLRYEIARVRKSHDDAVRTLEGKLNEFGIDHSEDYLSGRVFLGATTSGAAGLVAVSE